MARFTLTTAPQLVASGVARGGDPSARSFVALAPGGSGVALLERATAPDVAPDMSAAARWDFGKLALSYVCEPGVYLWASVASGTLDLDVLQGGEQ